MIGIQIALLVAIAIIIWAAYDYWIVFSENPQANWFIGVTGAAFLFAIKVMYDRFTLEVINERQYPAEVKNAMSAPNV